MKFSYNISNSNIVFKTNVNEILIPLINENFLSKNIFECTFVKLKELLCIDYSLVEDSTIGSSV